MGLTGYIEREGRQFGIETRVRLYAPGKEQVCESASPFFCVALVCKLWGLSKGHGWLPVR
jgi:hypothetical protein